MTFDESGPVVATTPLSPEDEQLESGDASLTDKLKADLSLGSIKAILGHEFRLFNKKKKS